MKKFFFKYIKTITIKFKNFTMYLINTDDIKIYQLYKEAKLNKIKNILYSKLDKVSRTDSYKKLINDTHQLINKMYNNQNNLEDNN